MDLQLRQEFQSSLERFSEKYGLAEITFPSFTLSFGYRNKYCASDVVYGLLAILENSVSVFCLLLHNLQAFLRRFFFARFRAAKRDLKKIFI